MKDYDVLNELVPKTQELHRAIFDKGYKQGQKDILNQQSCDDCVSRQAVLGQAVDYGSNTYLIPVNSVKTLPSATPKEKTGHWIYDEKSRVYRCSCCNRFPWRVQHENHDEIFTDLTRTNAYKYCPNCGARMVSG